MYENQNKLDMNNQITEAKKKQRLLQKIQVIKALARNVFTGYGNMTYIKISLKEIKLSKELFVLNIQQGDEVYIPGRLNLKKISLFY